MGRESGGSRTRTSGTDAVETRRSRIKTPGFGPRSNDHSGEYRQLRAAFPESSFGPSPNDGLGP